MSNTKTNLILASNIKYFMFLKSMNVTELAQITNISRNSISSIANAKSDMIRFSTIEALASAFDTEVHTLFTMTKALEEYLQEEIDKKERQLRKTQAELDRLNIFKEDK